MREPKLREVKSPAQGHTVAKWQSQNPSQTLLIPEPVLILPSYPDSLGQEGRVPAALPASRASRRLPHSHEKDGRVCQALSGRGLGQLHRGAWIERTCVCEVAQRLGGCVDDPTALSLGGDCSVPLGSRRKVVASGPETYPLHSLPWTRTA